MRKILLSAMIALSSAAPSIADDHGKHDQMGASKLDAILDARSDKLKARDQYRHPKETLEFFGVKEGMTVVDGLPGEWYGKIIAPLLGKDGTYIGSRYTVAHYEKMYGDRFSEKSRRNAENFPRVFPDVVKRWQPENTPDAKGFMIWEAPESMYGTVDVYMFFRVLHHLNKIDPAGLDDAAKEAFKLVKAGGVAGVVQHRAKEDRDDEWAQGWNGYLKESRVIEAFTKAGFVLEAKSEINANPLDKADVGDKVWRLKPTLSGSAEEKAKNAPIGESDRMTFRFRKPA